jgi:hypothetical protein
MIDLICLRRNEPDLPLGSLALAMEAAASGSFIP